MTNDELRALLEAVEKMEPCEVCSGPFMVAVPIDGGPPVARTYHDPDCPAA